MDILLSIILKKYALRCALSAIVYHKLLLMQKFQFISMLLGNICTVHGEGVAAARAAVLLIMSSMQWAACTYRVV